MGVVTAYHGQWFDRKTDVDNERIHVPLLIFKPDYSATTIEHTVNLRSIPRTTMEVLGIDHDFDGVDLTTVTEDQVSITEFIHDKGAVGKPVTPGGNVENRESVSYQSVVIEDGTRIDYDGGGSTIAGEPSGREKKLVEVAKKASPERLNPNDASIEYDDQTTERLRELGYLE
jgi:hypothetical protein